MRSTEALLPPECEPKSVMNSPAHERATRSPPRRDSRHRSAASRLAASWGRLARRSPTSPVRSHVVARSGDRRLARPLRSLERVARLSHPGRARPSRAAALARARDDHPTACSTAREVGDVLVRWTAEIGEVRRGASTGEGGKGGGPGVRAPRRRRGGRLRRRRTPRAAARHAAGRARRTIERAIGPDATAYVDVARDCYFPSLDGERWANVVRAAAVRAYVQLVDPTGVGIFGPGSQRVRRRPRRGPPRPGSGTTVCVPLLACESKRPTGSAAGGRRGGRHRGHGHAGLPVEQLTSSFTRRGTPASAPIVVLRRGEHALRTLSFPALDDWTPARYRSSNCLPTAFPTVPASPRCRDSRVRSGSGGDSRRALRAGRRRQRARGEGCSWTCATTVVGRRRGPSPIGPSSPACRSSRWSARTVASRSIRAPIAVRRSVGAPLRRLPPQYRQRRGDDCRRARGVPARPRDRIADLRGLPQEYIDDDAPSGSCG